MSNKFVAIFIFGETRFTRTFFSQKDANRRKASCPYSSKASNPTKSTTLHDMEMPGLEENKVHGSNASGSAREQQPQF
jgi:hypothetical protein